MRDEEIVRQDQQRFWRGLATPGGIVAVIGISVIFWIAARFDYIGGPLFIVFMSLFLVIFSMYILSKAKRLREMPFRNPRYAALWKDIEARYSRFKKVMKQNQKRIDLQMAEMPVTIDRVHQSVYFALRRSENVLAELAKSEGDLPTPFVSWEHRTKDPQATELFKAADINLAEYRESLQQVFSGVHRAEAQAAVFVTTLDSLRIKLLGYRLVGKRTEADSMEFLEALQEAKIQLQAIDTALDELDFSIMPKQVAVIQPDQEQNENA
ncbi:MAG: hypothetical protein ACK4P3_01620 [Fimbriimonadaceae bacterium]